MPRLTYKICTICKTIPDTYHLSFEDTGRPYIPEMYQPLQGWEGKCLGCGYQAFTVICPKCHMNYFVEIDVEPMVWDFDITRLSGKAKNYKGYYR